MDNTASGVCATVLLPNVTRAKRTCDNTGTVSLHVLIKCIIEEYTILRRVMKNLVYCYHCLVYKCQITTVKCSDSVRRDVITLSLTKYTKS